MFGSREAGAVIQLGVAAVLGHLEGLTKFEDIALKAAESSKVALAWLSPSKETAYKIFIGTLAVKYKDPHPEVYDRILTELRILYSINASISGIPVDMEKVIPEGYQAIGLQGIWENGIVAGDLDIPDLIPDLAKVSYWPNPVNAITEESDDRK